MEKEVGLRIFSTWGLIIDLRYINKVFLGNRGIIVVGVLAKKGGYDLIFRGWIEFFRMEGEEVVLDIGDGKEFKLCGILGIIVFF